MLEAILPIHPLRLYLGTESSSVGMVEGTSAQSPRLGTCRERSSSTGPWSVSARCPVDHMSSDLVLLGREKLTVCASSFLARFRPILRIMPTARLA